MIVCVRPKYHLLSFNEWSPAKIQLAITSFSAGKFCLQPALVDNPGCIANSQCEFAWQVSWESIALATVLEVAGIFFRNFFTAGYWVHNCDNFWHLYTLSSGNQIYNVCFINYLLQITDWQESCSTVHFQQDRGFQQFFFGPR